MPFLKDWIHRNSEEHEIALLSAKGDLVGGDILFLVSCSEKIQESERDRFRNVLVLHASDLPRGRGWSPHVWDIVEGADHITISLIEAEDEIDTGCVWMQQELEIPKHALWREINSILFQAEVEMIEFAVANHEVIRPQSQNPNIEPSYRRRRTPADSVIDPEKSISDQFDLLRVCDPDRFPAFFDYLGHRYKIRLEKVDG